MYDAVIIGAGPAGMSAAIYLSRASVKTAVIEKMPYPGGQILLTDEIENYPGFVKISAGELAESLRQHAVSCGAEFITGEVKGIEEGFVSLKNAEHINTKAIIIASGCTHRRLGIKGEKEFSGKGVSYCAVCDGPFFSSKPVAVIGGGDTALEEAVYLSKICESVTLIHRRRELRASKILTDRFFSLSNTELLPFEEAQEFTGDGALSGIKLKSGKLVSAKGVFIAVGQEPQTDFVPEKIKDSSGYVITDAMCKTALEGVFAAGDVRVKDCRQVVTAAADGAVVSRAVADYL